MDTPAVTVNDCWSSLDRASTGHRGGQTTSMRTIGLDANYRRRG
jgi:hypothetical protein